MHTATLGCKASHHDMAQQLDFFWPPLHTDVLPLAIKHAAQHGKATAP